MNKKELEWKVQKYQNQVIGNYDLGKGASNYLDLIASVFHLVEHEKAQIGQMAKRVWSDRQTIFGTNTSYENILLGITLKVLKDNRGEYSEHAQEMLDFLETLHTKNVNMNRISVYNTYQTIVDLFENTEPNMDSLEGILIQSFGLNTEQIMHLADILDNVLPKKWKYFDQLYSENIFLGAVIYVKEESEKHYDYENNVIEIANVIRFIHKDNFEEHLNEVKCARQMIQKLFS